MPGLRPALRQLRRHLVAAATCVLVLGIGIGSATAVFTVLYDAVLRPLPYRDADRLVAIHNEFPRSPAGQAGVSGPDFVDLSARHDLFSETAAYFFNDFTMTGTAYAQHVDAVNVSARVFDLLGIRPAHGRVFSSVEEQAGARVLVLSDGLWRSTFGGDPGAVGRTVALDGTPYRIVGVMPADFAFPYPATEMWVPLSLSPAQLAPSDRGRRWLQMIARLAPGLTPARANAALLTVSQSFAAVFPDAYPVQEGWHFSSRAIAAQQTERLRGWLVLAFGAVLCVLLIACTNASGLLLVQTSTRQGEWAVRAALGATPFRLLRQVAIETAILGTAACAIGIAVAAGAVHLANTFGPVRAAVGPWTYLFAILAALVCTMLAGLLPVARLWRVPLDRSLKAGGGRTSTGRRRGWTLLVAAQIAVAVALLFTATALTRSFLNLLNAPLGFSPDRVWTGAIQLADRGPGSRAASADFFERLTTRLAALPGVESASAGGQIPFNPGGVQIMNVVFPGRPVPDVRPAAEVNIVLPGYFRTLRIPRLEGRTFASQDAAGAPAVAVVDRTFARTYFANEDPIGQLVSSATTTYRIIGVVAPVADADLAAVPRPQIYLSERQEGQSATFLVVREAPGQDVTAMVRAQLRAMDPTVALFDVSPMSDRVASSIRLRRFVAWLLNGFAAMGLLLAALGLYGTLAHTVEARRREIAIRVALGAHAGRVRRLVARQGVRLAVAGLVPGLALAAAGGRITRAFLFGVAPFDPWTIFGTTAAVLLLAFAASWIPAARAARVDALAALREE